MSPVPIYREGENFYVPHFEVKIAGHFLPKDVLRDVSSVTYKDTVDDIDSFDLVVNNWDAETQKFKYEPSDNADLWEIFDPGKEVEVSMGYVGNAPLMLRGLITTLEPNYPESGVPTITVRGRNVLFRFKDKQHTWSWENKRDSDIAVEIGKQKRSDNKPGIGFRVKTNQQARDAEQEEELVFMNNQFDIMFLLARARRHNYSVFLGRDAEGEFINFGPSDQPRRPEYELVWGKSLSSFRPTLTTANQVSKVTVKGWDRRTSKPISATAELPKDCKLNFDQTAVQRAVAASEEIITNPPARTRKEAETRAKEALCNFRRELIKGAGVTVGLPKLRAGSNVHIDLGRSRFDGMYFVTATTHTIDTNGYRTNFEARREQQN
jgi:uncharacterized protein